MMQMAIELRPTISLEEFTLEQQQKIQWFGPLQVELQVNVEAISIKLNTAMSTVIEQNKQSALYSLFTLMALAPRFFYWREIYVDLFR